MVGRILVRWGISGHEHLEAYLKTSLAAVSKSLWCTWIPGGLGSKVDCGWEGPSNPGNPPVIPLSSNPSTHFTPCSHSPTLLLRSSQPLTQNKTCENIDPEGNSQVRLAFHGGHLSRCPQVALVGLEGLGVLEALPDLGHPGKEKGTDQQ